jgi:uncharacterized protein (TIGR02145 family)
VGDYLYLPAAGYRNISNGSLEVRGSSGFYWSSNADTSTADNAWIAHFGNGSEYVGVANKSYGYPVRCVAVE